MTPRNWKGFMENDGSGKSVDEWQKDTYVKRLHGRELFFVFSEECYCLTSTDSESVDVTLAGDLPSSQEEADTRMILHCICISVTNQQSKPISSFVLLIPTSFGVTAKICLQF